MFIFIAGFSCGKRKKLHCKTDAEKCNAMGFELKSGEACERKAPKAHTTAMPFSSVICSIA